MRTSHPPRPFPPRLVSAAATVLFAALLSSCSAESGGGPTAPDPVTVVASPKSLLLEVGQAQFVAATVVNGSPAVTWQSSNTSVATVNSEGRVTAMAVGTATVTVASVQSPAATASVQVTVTPPPVQVSVTPSSLSMSVGDQRVLLGSVTGAEGGVFWSSSSPSVASVSSVGRVTALSAGTATIRATAAGAPGAWAEATVTVTGPPSAIAIVVTNQLLNAVQIEVNGVVQGTVPANDTRQTTVPYTSNVQVSWSLVRSTTSQGTPIGDVIGGNFSTVTNPGGELTYTVDAVIGDQWIFRPAIVNQTGVSLLMGVNEGLQSQNRCNCVVAGNTSGTQIGYYRLYSNSNVRGYRQSAGYSGGYIYWDGFGNSVSATSGAVTLTATTPPPTAGPAPQRTVPGASSAAPRPTASDSDDVFRYR